MTLILFGTFVFLMFYGNNIFLGDSDIYYYKDGKNGRKERKTIYKYKK